MATKKATPTQREKKYQEQIDQLLQQNNSQQEQLQQQQMLITALKEKISNMVTQSAVDEWNMRQQMQAQQNGQVPQIETEEDEDE